MVIAEQKDEQLLGVINNAVIRAAAATLHSPKECQCNNVKEERIENSSVEVDKETV